MVCDMETSLNYLSKLSRSIVDCVVHILTWNSEVVGGDQLWRGGTAYSAVDGPRGDHLQCHGRSGGTKYSAMYGPGGPLLGGTTCSMTGVHLHELDRIEEECSTNIKRRLQRTLSLWLQRKPNASWLDVVNALRKMGQNRVAESILQKYIREGSKF